MIGRESVIWPEGTPELHSLRDLCSLCRVSWRVCHLVQPLIYEHVSIPNLDHGKGSKFVASLSQNRGVMSKHLFEAKALTWGTGFNNPIDHGTTHLLPQIMLEIEMYTMVLHSVPKIKLLRLGDMTDTASHALEAFLRKKDDSPQLELEQRNTKLSAVHLFGPTWRLTTGMYKAIFAIPSVRSITVFHPGTRTTTHGTWESNGTFGSWLCSSRFIWKCSLSVRRIPILALLTFHA